MERKELFKEFTRLVIPAFVGAIGMQIYYFTDGIFAGNACGDDGMSTLSLSWTFVNYIIALSTGIGMGGAIKYSIFRDDKRKASLYFIETIRMLIICCLVCFAFFLFTYKNTLVRYGATGTLYKCCLDYSKVIIYGTFIQVFAYGLLPMLRNLDANREASTAMGIGYIVNFVLDYVLMILIPWEMFGCAMAYMAGQFLIFVVCIRHTITAYKSIEKQHYDFKERLSAVKDICITGLGPLGIFLSGNIMSTAVSTNFVQYGGSESLAAYTTSNYITGITAQLMNAILNGAQPLISKYYGEKETAKWKLDALYMYIFCFVLTIITDVIVLIFINPIARSFGLSENATDLILEKLPVFIYFYDCYLMVRMTNSYMNSIDKPLLSTIVTYTIPVSTVTLLLILPKMFDITGVWYTVELADLLGGLCSLFMIIYISRKEK